VRSHTNKAQIIYNNKNIVLLPLLLISFACVNADGEVGDLERILGELAALQSSISALNLGPEVPGSSASPAHFRPETVLFLLL
jgi:hypothetical protein